MFKWVSYLSPEPMGIVYSSARAWQEAGEVYDRLYQQAKHAHMRAVLTGHWGVWGALRALEDQGAIAQSQLPELQTIPLAQIRGTEGRRTDFDAEFRPLHPRMRERWQNVATAFLLGQPLPPIEVIRVGDLYYVRDGHHRVSVALALGQTDIEAQVVVWTILEQTAPRPGAPAGACGAPLAA